MHVLSFVHLCVLSWDPALIRTTAVVCSEEEPGTGLDSDLSPWQQCLALLCCWEGVPAPSGFFLIPKSFLISVILSC